VGLAQIVCRGLGPGATIALLVTVGYVSGAAVVPPPPPPPPVVEVLQDATPGPLTPAQIARLRGFVAPPFRAPQDDDETDAARGQDPAGPAPGFTGLVTPAPRSGPLAPLLATARAVDPGPDWAQVLTLAARDTQRRQAQAQAAEDEAALMVVLVLVEEL
jgi:hypothetical protein